MTTPYYSDDLVTIYHGDCREWTELPGDVMVTDPPYGIGANAMRLGSRPVWRQIDRGDRDWDSEAGDLTHLLSRGIPTVIWGGNHFALPPSRGWLVWDKDNGATSYADCELAWTNLDMPVRRYRVRWSGPAAKERTDSAGMGGIKSGTGRDHPTQKPVELIRWVLGFLPPGAVMDPFMGGGSTLRAAKSLGRRAIGIEIEERYCEIAAQRCSQEVLGLAV